MMPLDPETDGLVKLAFDQKRAVEEGRMELEDAFALPPGTTIEGGRVKLPDTGVGAGLILLGAGASAIGLFILMALGVALILSAVRAGLSSNVNGVPAYLLLAAAGCIAAVGWGLWLARDHHKWPAMAVIQIIVATFGGVVGFFFSPDLLTSWITAVLACIGVADGWEKLARVFKKGA